MDRTLPYNRMCGYNSDDEGPEEELDEDGLTAQENEIYKKVTGKERGPPLFRDVSLADNAVVDGGLRFGLSEPTPCPKFSDPRLENEDENAHLKKGIKFGSLVEFKIWLCDYAIRNHRPFVVGHSNQKVRYTVKCDQEGCKWMVRGRKIKETGQWVLKNHVGTHTCVPPDKADRSKGHRQLMSKYLGYKLLNQIAHDPTVKVKFLMSSIEELFGYPVKYGKAWMAKANAIRMLHGDYEAAYNILPKMLAAIAHRNPGMCHRVESTDGVFRHAFWSFGQCIEAFTYCRPVLSIDGTFLTGKYKGTLMVAMAHSSNDNVLPVAFALVPSEHDDNWEWFMGHVRTKVIGKREVCIISDRRHGILKAIDVDIPGLPKLQHRWCMRHFVANFYRACKSKEFCKDLTLVCVAFNTDIFKSRYDKLLKALEKNKGGKEFLLRHEPDKEKWSRAYDEGGMRYGDMTSNMVECFNNVLKGVRSLPMTAILKYTFIKLNEYFLKHSESTAKWIGEKMDYPLKVHDWLLHQARKSSKQQVIKYNEKEISIKSMSRVGQQGMVGLMVELLTRCV
ncbi:uncharacterized protein [Aegilops tauschii subsp. strangulata]|uniref:uncharacterized protein n=1 Tax=Aegilops tauschii subsp. strangulata TaxID=200361 RepID=UPI00098AC9F0|nr:uncharacterized protein LOC109765744 [Aegilops tauschii subsp. strangulata]